MVPNQQTKQVFVGGTPVGGGAPVTVQSMLSVRADDREGNIAQALRLQQAGCDILRISVPDAEAVKTLAAVKEHCSLPLVADIHFDYRLALESVAAGADKIRINPGNIGDDQKVKAVADACRTHHIPIRVGVNAGSLEKELLETYGAPTPEAMVESGRRHIALLEKFDFTDIVLSLKSSDVQKTVRAYELAAQSLPYPLHLGVTEAGTVHMGTLRSAAGIGGLLLRGIGDTFRVSLTDDPEREVEAGRDLLRAIGLRTDKIRFVSCPTCGRTKIDLITLAKQAEERLSDIQKPLTVAVMGCVVNGPGEAREADIGIAGGDGCGVLFKKGEILRKIPEDRLLDELVEEVKNLITEL